MSDRQPSSTTDGSLVRIEDPELAKTVERARTRLLLEQPSLAAAVMRIPVVQVHSDELPAGIGSARGAIVVSQALRLKNDAWISYAYAHNLIHFLFEHLERRGSRDRAPWDTAIDIAAATMIDPLLSPEVLNYIEHDPRPAHSADFKTLVDRLGHLSCEQIYDKLVQGPRATNPTNAGSQANGSPSPTEEDPIARYLRISRLPQSGRAPTSAPTTATTDSNPNPEFEGDRERSGHSYDLEVSLGHDASCSDLDRALVIQEIAEALGDAGKLAGTEAGRWRDVARQSRTRAVPWERVFAERLSGLMPSDFQTFPFAKRHLWRGVYLPSVARKGVGRILFAIDTSGSMSLGVLGQITDQIDQLRQATACSLTIAHFDTEIRQTRNFDEFQDPIERGMLEMPGRGGTDLRAPFKHAAELIMRGETFAGVIVATDGCGPIPTNAPGYPTIWLVPDTDARSFSPPFGTVIACGRGALHAR